MSLPIVVIADDSLLARKVFTKALPLDWQVDASYAANGRKALALYREGKASVMFLDLTMPDMTGYQVLEALQHEDLNTFVIVVSADIRPVAQERVRALLGDGVRRETGHARGATTHPQGLRVVCLSSPQRRSARRAARGRQSGDGPGRHASRAAARCVHRVVGAARARGGG